MLLRLATSAQLPATECIEAGRDYGLARATQRAGTGLDGVEVLMEELAVLGFDPESVTDEQGTTIAFTRCPFQELAEGNPDVICSLHRGLVAGVLEGAGGADVVGFNDLVSRPPCQVEISPARR
jgi:predicted ArsR family transcriptional regulator